MDHDVRLLLGMCFHELATNASKHGALKSKGRISISWRMTDRSELEIRWDEAGLTKAARPGKSGFGTKLLTKMAGYDLLGRSSLVIAGSTLRWRCEIPLTNLAGSDAHLL